MSEEEVERVMRAGVTGPYPPANGASVDVEMDECPSCGWGPTTGKAWLVRSGGAKGTICVRCEVCWKTLLGNDESGADRKVTAQGVAGGVNMILEAIAADRRSPLQEAFLRVSVLRGKKEILKDLKLGHFPLRSIASFSDLHDYRDANEYGGLCDAEYMQAWGIPPDLEMAAGARVQEELDGWIRGGALAGVPKVADGSNDPDVVVARLNASDE